MNKKLLVLVFLALIVMAGFLGFYLSVPSGQRVSILPQSVRRMLVEIMGTPNVSTHESIGKQENKLAEITKFPQLPTMFAEESAMDGSSHIQSMTFDLDGYERVMIRGTFRGFKETPIVANLLGRRVILIQSAGKEFEVFFGKTVKMECAQSNFYDKNGVKHDITKVFVDYNSHVDTAELTSTTKAMSLLRPGDNVVVVARYTEEMFDGLLLVGFDCSL